MKVSLFILIVILFSFGCTPKTSEEIVHSVVDKTESLYGTVVADTIIYDVIIKNTDPEDLWAAECLRNLHQRALIDSIFEMVYSERTIAYDFFTKRILKTKEIIKMESEEEYSRDHIGKIQFTERWYFDKSSQKFQKEVISLVLGYELFNNDNSLRGYKPVFKIYLKN
jgi:hypothetical protein